MVAWWVPAVTLFVGAWIGVGIMAFANISKSADRHIEMQEEERDVSL